MVQTNHPSLQVRWSSKSASIVGATNAHQMMGIVKMRQIMKVPFRPLITRLYALFHLSVSTKSIRYHDWSANEWVDFGHVEFWFVLL